MGTSAENAARRLLKSRLRLHVLEGLAEAQPETDWPSALTVERSCLQDAWASWVKVRSNVVPTEALKAAVESVKQTFKGSVEEGWLETRIQSFTDNPPDLMGVLCK